LQTLSSQSRITNPMLLKYAGKMFGGFENVQRALGAPGHYTEIAGRLAIMRAAKDQFPGMSDADAAMIARRNMDYQAGGAHIKALDSFALYLNASQRAIYGVVDSARKHPLDMAYAGVWLMAAGAAKQLLWDAAFGADDEGDDEETKRMKHAARAMKENPGMLASKNNIIIPAGQPYLNSETGAWNYPFFKVKIDQSSRLPMAIGANLVRRATGRAVDAKELALAAQDLSALPNPFSMVPTFGLAFSLLMNKQSDLRDAYSGAAVDPYAEEDLDTPNLFRAFGLVGSGLSHVPGVDKLVKNQVVGGLFSPARWSAGAENIFGNNPMYAGILYAADQIDRDKRVNNAQRTFWESLVKSGVASGMIGVAKPPKLNQAELMGKVLKYGINGDRPTEEVRADVETHEQMLNTIAKNYTLLIDRARGDGDAIQSIMNTVSERTDSGELPFGVLEKVGEYATRIQGAFGANRFFVPSRMDIARGLQEQDAQILQDLNATGE